MEEIVKKLNEIISLTSLYRELKELLYSDIQFLYSIRTSKEMTISVDVEERTYKNLGIDTEDGMFKCIDTIFKFNKIEIDPSSMLMWFKYNHASTTFKALYKPVDLLEAMCNLKPEDLDKAIAITSNEEAKKTLQKLKEFVAVASTVLDA